MLAICPGLCLYVRSYQKKISIFLAILWRGHPIFCLQRNSQKNTKENLPPDHFCSHLRQDGQIDILSSPDCHIFIGVSENSHNDLLGRHNGHMPIWLFDAIMAIWPYSHLAIMVSNVDNMGVFGNGNKNVTIW